MIYLSQVYLKMSSFKTNSIVLDYASENGIKQGFDQLIQSLTLSSSPRIISEERKNELKSDVQDGGAETVSELIKGEIPLTHTETWEK